MVVKQKSWLQHTIIYNASIDGHSTHWTWQTAWSSQNMEARMFQTKLLLFWTHTWRWEIGKWHTSMQPTASVWACIKNRGCFKVHHTRPMCVALNSYQKHFSHTFPQMTKFGVEKTSSHLQQYLAAAFSPYRWACHQWEKAGRTPRSDSWCQREPQWTDRRNLWPLSRSPSHCPHR